MVETVSRWLEPQILYNSSMKAFFETNSGIHARLPNNRTADELRLIKLQHGNVARADETGRCFDHASANRKIIEEHKRSLAANTAFDLLVYRNSL